MIPPQIYQILDTIVRDPSKLGDIVQESGSDWIEYYFILGGAFFSIRRTDVVTPTGGGGYVTGYLHTLYFYPGFDRTLRELSESGPMPSEEEPMEVYAEEQADREMKHLWKDGFDAVQKKADRISPLLDDILRKIS